MQPPDHSDTPTDTNTSDCFSASDMPTNDKEPETKVIRAISTQGVIRGVSTQGICTSLISTPLKGSEKKTILMRGVSY